MSVAFRSRDNYSIAGADSITHIGLPSGAAVGDVYLVWAYAYKASATGTLSLDQALPAKYKQLFQQVSADGKGVFACYYRVLQSGDIGTEVSLREDGVLASATVMLATAECYSGADPIGSTSVVSAVVAGASGSLSTIDAPSVTTPWATCKVVAAFAGYSGGTDVSSTPNPAGMTERADHQDAGNLGQMAVDDVEQVAAGASGAKTFTVNGGTIAAGIAGSVVIRPPEPPQAPTVSAISPAYGPITGGTPVTITGADFYANATVTIGGSAATSVVFVDSETLTCVTPAHAVGNAAVAVTTDYGTGTLS